MDYLKLKHRWAESLRDLYSSEQIDTIRQEDFLKRVIILMKIKDAGGEVLLSDMYQLSKEIAEALNSRTSRAMVVISFALDIWPSSLGDVDLYLSKEIKARISSFSSMIKESCYDIDSNDPYTKDLLMCIELDILSNELNNKLPLEQMAVYYRFSEMKCYRAMLLLGKMLHPWYKKEHCHDIGQNTGFNLIDIELSRVYLLEALKFYTKARSDKHHPSHPISNSKEFLMIIGEIQAMLGSARMFLGLNNDDAFHEAYYRYLEAITAGYTSVVKEAARLMVMPNSPIEVDLAAVETLIGQGEKSQDPWSISMKGRIYQLDKDFYSHSLEDSDDEDGESSAIDKDLAIMFALSENFWSEYSNMAEMYMNLLMTPSLPAYDLKKASQIAEVCLGKEREFQMAALTFASSSLDIDEYQERSAKIVCNLAESGNKEAYINYGIILFNHSEWTRSAMYLIKGLKHLGNGIDNDTRSNLYLKIADAYIHTEESQFADDVIKFLQRGFSLGYITSGYRLCVYYMHKQNYEKSDFYLRQVLNQIEAQRTRASSAHPMDDLNFLEISTKKYLGKLHIDKKLKQSDPDFGEKLLLEVGESGYLGVTKNYVPPEIELGLYKVNGTIH